MSKEAASVKQWTFYPFGRSLDLFLDWGQLRPLIGGYRRPEQLTAFVGPLIFRLARRR